VSFVVKGFGSPISAIPAKAARRKFAAHQTVIVSERRREPNDLDRRSPPCSPLPMSLSRHPPPIEPLLKTNTKVQFDRAVTERSKPFFHFFQGSNRGQFRLCFFIPAVRSAEGRGLFHLPNYQITHLTNSVGDTVETRQFTVFLFVKELREGPHTLRRSQSIRLSYARINSESGHVLVQMPARHCVCRGITLRIIGHCQMQPEGRNY
jgi:hypothetical protein